MPRGSPLDHHSLKIIEVFKMESIIQEDKRKETLVKKGKRRQQVSQKDVPAYSLSKTLRIPKAIVDNYAKEPTKPLRVAEALNLSPNSSQFKMLCGASIAYGLTEGGYNAKEISLTELSKRIFAPLKEGDNVAAQKEALLKPRVVGEFLRKFDNSNLPKSDIAKNILEEMGVPSSALDKTWDLIVKEGQQMGIIRELKDKQIVDLEIMDVIAKKVIDNEIDEDVIESKMETALQDLKPASDKIEIKQESNNNVYITHGSNKAVVEQLKEIITYGSFKPIVSVEKETSSKPIPQKVMDDMRTCGAAIIHVSAEKKLKDDEGKEHTILNQNVLIEIGAAMGLYKDKFILLVEEGIKLPSNLQGLYEVRYKGAKLDSDATMKLLRALNDFK